MTNPKYLTKFPIGIRKKKHDRANSITGEVKHFNETNCYDFISKYGYFAIDHKNNVTFTISLVDRERKCTYNIKIAKQYLYDSLLLNLQYRPIVRKGSRTEKFYAHKHIKTILAEIQMNDLTPLQIKERYLRVKDGLEEYIKITPDDTYKRTAELQLERLISQQWKMELLNDIYIGEKVLDRANELLNVTEPTNIENLVPKKRNKAP